MNNWVFIGHLGQNAVVQILDGGVTVINFSVAITEKYKNKQGVLVEKTSWVSCSKFGEHTKVAEFLLSGTMVAIEGRPQVRAYQKQGGEIMGQLCCIVNQIDLLVTKKQASQTTEQPTSEPPVYAENNSAEGVNEDLPF